MDDAHVRSYHGRQTRNIDLSIFHMWQTRPVLNFRLDWSATRDDILAWIQSVINHLLRYRQNGLNICCLPNERVTFIHRHYGSLVGAPTTDSSVMIDHIHATVLDLARRRIDIHALDHYDIHKIAIAIYDEDNPIEYLYNSCLRHPPFAKCPICVTRQIDPNKAHPIYAGQCCICNPYMQVDGITGLFGNITLDPIPDLRLTTDTKTIRPPPNHFKTSKRNTDPDENWS